MTTRASAQRVARQLNRQVQARRVVGRYFEAKTPNYKDYVQRAKKDGKKPMPKDEWESRVLGKGKDEKRGRGVKEKLKKLFSKVKPNAKMKKALEGAPEKVQQFFADSSFRNKATKEMAKGVKKAAGKIASAIATTAKSEVASFGKAAKIMGDLVKEKRKPTKEETKTLYGVGVYVAGTAIGAATAGTGGAAFAGAKALLHSLGSHIAIQSMSQVADDVFLHYETAESFATVGGLADKLPFGTGAIPGVGQVMDFARNILASDMYHFAAEKDDAGSDDIMDKFVKRMLEEVVSKLEGGISDEDIKAILENG